MVATDLDGTLLRSDKTVSPRTAAAMQRAQDAGIEVVWATARAQHSVYLFAEQASFRGIAVCANGAVVLDLAEGVRIKQTCPISLEVALAAISQVREMIPGSVFALVGPTGFIAERGYAEMSVFGDHHRHPHKMPVVDRLESLDDAIVKICARHPEMPVAELFALVTSLAPDQIEMTYSLAPYVEMAAAGITKASALEVLATERGIDASEVAAIGDAMNDFAMLTWAGTAVAPANAIPDITEIADIFVPSNNDDGVAVYLESLLDLG